MGDFSIDRRDDGILAIVFRGDLSDEDVAQYTAALAPYLDKVPETGPLRLLVDASSSGKLSPGGRKVFYDLVNDGRIGRVAGIGATDNRYAKLMVRFALRIMRRNHIQIFESTSDAVAWLKEK